MVAARERADRLIRIETYLFQILPLATLPWEDFCLAVGDSSRRSGDCPASVMGGSVVLKLNIPDWD